MSVNLTVNGVTYAYPELDDENWASAATGWAQAVTAGMLQKAGGAFTLTADVDFGATYGLKSAYYKSRTSNVASAGQIRLANTDIISFRNAANDDNLDLEVNPANDHLLFNGIDLTAAASGNVFGPGTSTDNAVPRFDGTDGQHLNNSGVIVDDSNNVSGVVGLTLTGAIGTPTAITLNNAATHGGRVNFDGGSSSYIGSSADGATLQVAGFTDATVPAGVANDIRDATTRSTGTTVGVGGIATDSNDGQFSLGTSEATVTNTTVTITTTGRPVLYCVVSAVPAVKAPNSYITVPNASDGATFYLQRDGVTLYQYILEGVGNTLNVPVSVLSFIDFPSAGTYTYRLRAKEDSSDSAVIGCYRVVCYEL